MAIALTGLIEQPCAQVTGMGSRMVSSVAVSFFISTYLRSVVGYLLRI